MAVDHHQDIFCNHTHFSATLAAPKSFVIEPEFNDLPPNIADDGSVGSTCSIKQVNYRLYPTYRISVKDNSLCGVSSSSTSLNDNATRNKHVDPQGSRGEQADSSLQHSELDELDKLDDTIYASKASLLVLHIRFPVVKSLRTDEDNYVSLVCAPELDGVASRQIAASTAPNKRPHNSSQDESDKRRYGKPMLVGNGLRSATDIIEPSMEESQVVPSMGLEATTTKSTDVVQSSGLFASSIRRVGELAVGSRHRLAVPTSSVLLVGPLATTDRPRGTARPPLAPSSGAYPPVPVTQIIRDIVVNATGSTSSLSATKAELATIAPVTLRTIAVPISSTTTTSKSANVSDLNSSAFTTGKLDDRGKDYNVVPVIVEQIYSGTPRASRPGAYLEVRGSERRHVTNCTLGKQGRPKLLGSEESELNMFLLVLFLALLIIIFIFAIIIDNLSNS